MDKKYLLKNKKADNITTNLKFNTDATVIVQKELFVIVLVFAISIAVSIDQAEGAGLIEAKKYKVINSPKVCGDKMCSEIDEQRAKKGLSSRDIKVCGDRPCHEIVVKTSTINKSGPLGQFRLGIPLDLIQCKESHHLVIKTVNMFPACVKVENMEKLRQRGVMISEIKQQKIFEKLAEDRKKENIPDKTIKDFSTTLSVKSDQIYNQRYLMFEGDGWHGYHNVEITISGDNFSESVLTKTDKRGHLNMPWPIPDSVGGMRYHIFATDGIHEFEMDMPIAP
jgi:hypothetical protein